MTLKGFRAILNGFNSRILKDLNEILKAGGWKGFDGA